MRTAVIAVAAGLLCCAGGASANIDVDAAKSSGILREKSDILRKAEGDAGVRPHVSKGSQRLRVAKKGKKKHAIKKGWRLRENGFLSGQDDRIPGAPDPAGNGSVPGGGTGVGGVGGVD